MVYLPIIILILGAIFIPLLSRRSLFVQWVGAILLVVLDILLLLLMGRNLPVTGELSVWRPVSLFNLTMELELGVISWPMLLFLMTGLLFNVLLYPVDSKEPLSSTYPWIMMLTVFVGAVILSANALTATLFLPLLDITWFGFMSKVVEAKDRDKLMSRLVMESVGMLILVAVIVLHLPSNPSDNGGLSYANLVSTSLFLAAILFRSGILQGPIEFKGNQSLGRGTAAYINILPFLALIAIIARQEVLIEGGWALLPVTLAGAAFTLGGSLSWFLSSREGDPLHLVAITGLGFSLLLSTGSETGSDLAVVAVGITTAFLALSWSRPYSDWPVDRFGSYLAVLIIAGLPGSTGGLVAQYLGVGSDQAPIIQITTAFGLAFLAAGYYAKIHRVERAEEMGEAGVRWALRIAVGLLLLFPVALGLLITPRVSLGTGLSFSIISVIAALLVYADIKGIIPDRRSRPRLMNWVRLRSIGLPAVNLLRRSLGIVRGIGNAFEGEGALLWVYLVVLITVLITSLHGGSLP